MIPWWGWLLISLGGLTALISLITLLVFAGVGISFIRSFKNWW